MPEMLYNPQINAQNFERQNIFLFLYTMKIVLNRVFFIILTVFYFNPCLANGPTPPQPIPVPPPGLPIDSNIYILFIAAFAYGLFAIKQHKTKKRVV